MRRYEVNNQDAFQISASGSPGVDLRALASQLGSAHALEQFLAAPTLPELAAIRDIGSLDHFLQRYLEQILLPLELPAIQRAFEHASRGEARELIALDQELSSVVELQKFRDASCRVGRIQLRALKPLRGERLVPRYWAAVEKGQAHAWHTVVFGLVLGVYSLPLRQGLHHYAQQTLNGFVTGSVPALRLTDQAVHDLQQTVVARAVPFVESHFAAMAGPTVLQ